MFSIIVPFKSYNDDIKVLIKKLNKIEDSKIFELILLPDSKIDYHSINKIFFEYKILPTGEIGPSLKRNLGAKIAKYEYLLFLDSDAYPKDKYFEILLKKLDILENSIIGGPGIAPPNQTFIEKFIDTSFIGMKFLSGNPERYMPIKNIKIVDELPSMNMIIKKKNFNLIGGFKNIWPGEDTDFCYKAKKFSIKCFYISDLVVVHKRRLTLIKHIKQIYNYGLMRSYIIKKNKFSILHLKYFAPSTILLTFIFSILNYKILIFLIPYIILLLINILFLNLNRNISLLISLLSPFSTLITHMSYGFGIIAGLISHLNEKNI